MENALGTLHKMSLMKKRQMCLYLHFIQQGYNETISNVRIVDPYKALKRNYKITKIYFLMKSVVSASLILKTKFYVKKIRI